MNVTVRADEVVKVLGEIERKEEEEDSATCKCHGDGGVA
jgi:hypothetical protein